MMVADHPYKEILCPTKVEMQSLVGIVSCQNHEGIHETFAKAKHCYRNLGKFSFKVIKTRLFDAKIILEKSESVYVGHLCG